MLKSPTHVEVYMTQYANHNKAFEHAMYMYMYIHVYVHVYIHVHV